MNGIVPQYNFPKRAPKKASVLLLEVMLLVLFLLGATLYYYDFMTIEKIEIVENYHIFLWIVLSILLFMDFAALAWLTKKDKSQVMYDPPYIIR